MNPRLASIIAAASALLTASAAHAQVIGCACDGDYEVGDRVVALVDNPNSAPGLPAGSLGTIVCGIDTAGPIELVVRWDGWTNGSSVNADFCDCPAPIAGANGDWFVLCAEIEPFVPVRNITQGTEHQTIGDGIAASVAGDVLELGPYTFYEHDIWLDNRDITIRGQGPGVTIIDGGGVFGPMFLIRFGDESVFEGLTIRNGFATFGAVQVMGDHTSVTFRDCDFVSHTAESTNGPLYVEFAAATLIRCRFDDNIGTVPGGDVIVFDGGLTAVNCVFGDGGGSASIIVISDYAPCVGTLVNCTFAKPTGDHHLRSFGTENTIELVGCVFGAGPSQGAFLATDGALITASRSVFPGAGGDNIDGAPTFVDAPNGDYRLAPGSLGIDAADYDAYAAIGGGPVDLAGAFRYLDDPGVFNTGVGATTQLDCGAFEFQGESAAPTGCPGDINGDGYTDLTDFGIFASDFGCTPAP